jgi:hypothetical protein
LYEIDNKRMAWKGQRWFRCYWRLDEVYINARYPTDLGLLPYGKPSTGDAKQFYEFAIELYGNVRKLLGVLERSPDVRDFRYTTTCGKTIKPQRTQRTAKYNKWQKMKDGINRIANNL